MTAPAPAEAPLPRRLTASRLFGALTRQPRFRDAMAIHQVVPYGAMVVLKALCQGIVDSPELGFYRPPQRLRDQVEVAIASRLGRSGAEEQVASDLDALIEAGMVVEAEGAWTVPVDLPALLQGAQQPGTRSMARPIGRWTEAELGELSARQRSAIINGHKGGRPRKRVPGQRELAVHAVVAGNPEAPRPQRTETHGETHGALGFAENPSDAQAGFLGSSSWAAAVFPQEVDSLVLEGEQQLGSEEPSGARGKPTPGFGGNPAGETQGAETQGAETQGAGTQASRTAAEAPSSLDRLRRAGVLAMAVADIAGLSGLKGTAGATKAGEWLSLPGMTQERVEEVVRRCKERHAARMERDPATEPIGSFDYFDEAVRVSAGLTAKPNAAGRAAGAGGSQKPGTQKFGGFDFPAEVDRTDLRQAEPDALPYLSGAFTLAAKADDAALGGSVKRLGKHPRALALFRRLTPDLDERIARATEPRRATG